MVTEKIVEAFRQEILDEAYQLYLHLKHNGCTMDDLNQYLEAKRACKAVVLPKLEGRDMIRQRNRAVRPRVRSGRR